MLLLVRYSSGGRAATRPLLVRGRAATRPLLVQRPCCYSSATRPAAVLLLVRYSSAAVLLLVRYSPAAVLLLVRYVASVKVATLTDATWGRFRNILAVSECSGGFGMFRWFENVPVVSECSDGFMLEPAHAPRL